MKQRRYHDEKIPMTPKQQALVTENQRLIYYALRRWSIFADILGEEEAVAIAQYAMCVAAKRHDPAVSKWSTYATNYIRGYWLQRLEKMRNQVPTTTMDGVPDWFLAAPEDEDSGLEPEPKRQLLHAIKQLTKPQRDAITLRYLRGLTRVQACKKLRITYTALDQRLKAGIRKLRQLLAHKETAFFMEASCE